MSRHHHRPAHKRGWPRIRARAILDAGRRCTRCGFAGKRSVKSIRSSAVSSEGGTHDQSLQSCVCRDLSPSHAITDRTPRGSRGRSFYKSELSC